MQNKVNAILGAVIALLLGFLVGLLVGKSMLGGGGDIKFSDGRTLETRLNELDAKIDDTKKAAENASEILTRITQRQEPQQPKRPDTDKKYDFDLSSSPWAGAKNPKVEVVEFSDFQCPFCKRMASLLDELVEQYPNDLRVYFKSRVVHPAALPAHEAAMAANAQGKFWEMYNILWANNRNLSPEDLERYASEAGLDVGRFKSDMESGKFKGLVSKDDEEAKEALINSTPTVFINGYFEPNVSPDNIRQKIEEAIKGGN